MAEFNEVVKGIKNAEKNVDKVLKAARLDRTPRRRLSDDNVETIIMMTFALLFFGIICLLMYALR